MHSRCEELRVQAVPFGADQAMSIPAPKTHPTTLATPRAMAGPAQAKVTALAADLEELLPDAWPVGTLDEALSAALASEAATELMLAIYGPSLVSADSRRWASHLPGPREPIRSGLGCC